MQKQLLQVPQHYLSANASISDHSWKDKKMLEKYTLYQRQIERKETPEDDEELKNNKDGDKHSMDGLGTTKKTSGRKSKSTHQTNDEPSNTTPGNVKLTDLSLMEQVRIRLRRQQGDRRQSINTSFRSISSHESGKDRIESFNNTSRTAIMDDGSRSYDSSPRTRSSRERRSSISQSLMSILDDGNNKESSRGGFGSSSTQFDRSLVIFDGNIVDPAMERKLKSKSSAPSAVAPPITDGAEYITTKKVVCIVDEAMIHSVSQSLESSLGKFQEEEQQRSRSLSRSPHSKPRSKRRNKRPSKSYERPFEFVQVPL